MTNNLVYLPKSQKEFNESFEFYEERVAGLGERFESRIEKKIQGILTHPERYRKRNKNFREARVNGFPFLIIYKYYKAKNLITVYSIFHTSRNTKYKYRK